MKIKLSKSQWEKIGNVAGWAKEAMAVPITDELRGNMAKQGIFVLMNMYKRMPNATQAQMKAVLQNLNDTGATDFFQTLDPKTVVQLPAIYKADPKDLIEIDGSQYYVVDLTEPRDVKRKSNINGREYQKGDRYPGEIICMDVETGLPVPFIYEEIIDDIRTPSGNREQTLTRMNDEIAAWNERVESIENAVGVTKLSLQVKWVENKIQERIDTLGAQREAIQSKIENPLEAFPEYGNWIQFIRDEVIGGRSNLRDVFDSLLFIYQSNPQSLMSGIESGEIEVPDELRNGLLAIAAQELQIQGEKEQSNLDKARAKEVRREEELPEEREVDESPLRPLTLEEIPEEKYKKLRKNKTLQHWAASLRYALNGIDSDIQDLTNIVGSFENLRAYMGALEKGQRSEAYLSSPEGGVIINDLKSFLNITEDFIKRYEIDIIKDGTINTALMGRAGSMGNALIAVALNRIYNIIKASISKAIGERVAPEVEIPAAPEVPVEASKQNRIEKLSSILWDCCFKKRMSLK